MTLFPELERIEDPHVREAVYNAAKDRLRSRAGHTFQTIAAGILLAAVIAVSAYWTQRYLGYWGFGFLLLIWNLCVGLIYWMIDFWFRVPMRKFIRLEMLDRGYAICAECAYDLRGQTEPRCPECGAQFPGTLPESRQPEPPPRETHH